MGLWDQRLRSWAVAFHPQFSSIIPISSVHFQLCHVRRLSINQCHRTSTAAAVPPRLSGWYLGAEHLLFHELFTLPGESLLQGFLLGAAELRFSLPGQFFEPVPLQPRVSRAVL